MLWKEISIFEPSGFVAQWLEHWTSHPKVAGWNPTEVRVMIFLFHELWANHCSSWNMRMRTTGQDEIHDVIIEMVNYSTVNRIDGWETRWNNNITHYLCYCPGLCGNVGRPYRVCTVFLRKQPIATSWCSHATNHHLITIGQFGHCDCLIWRNPHSCIIHILA